MAIKGKSKKRSAPKQVARAPRREPVAVKPPVFQRRWVQVTSAFLVGMLAFMALIWFTNGLRSSREKDAAAAHAATKLKAAQSWQAAVGGSVGKLGAAQQGLPPTVFPEMSSALDQMKKDGTAPKGAAGSFTTASRGAASAIKTLTAFDLAGTISGKGFDQTEASSFTSSKDGLIGALELYQKSAQVGAQALNTSGPQRLALAKIAADLRDQANTELDRAWTLYQAGLAAGGAAAPPNGPIAGLPGGGA
jgi:hypothetical protein